MNLININHTMQQIIELLSVNWAMSAALLIVFTLILVNEIQFLKKKGKELSPQAVVSLINNDNAVVIDIRDIESFQNGHILDALHAKPEDFSLPKMGQYKEKSLVLVCNRGIQAGQLAIKLRSLGFKHPIVLSGGMTAWEQALLPVHKKQPSLKLVKKK